MQRLILMSLAAVSLGCTTGTAVGSDENVATAQASLRLVSQQPIAVQGRSFAEGERVQIVLRKPGRHWIRGVRANRRGLFQARFTGVSLARCESFSVRATGSHGSVAALKLAAPACKPDRSD